MSYQPIPARPPVFWRGTNIRQRWWQRLLMRLAIPARVRVAWEQELGELERLRRERVYPVYCAESPELTAAQMLELKHQRTSQRQLDFNPAAPAQVIRPAVQKMDRRQ